MSLQALSQPPAARSSGVVSGSLSLSSYQEYPAHHPFVNTPQTRVRLSQPPALPSKALPETNSAGDFQSMAPVLVCMRGSFRLGIAVVRCTMATACATWCHTTRVSRLQRRPSFVHRHRPPCTIQASRLSCGSLFWAECKIAPLIHVCNVFTSSNPLRTKEPPGKDPKVGVGQGTRGAQPA